jgi:hypothetical protein
VHLLHPFGSSEEVDELAPSLGVDRRREQARWQSLAARDQKFAGVEWTIELMDVTTCGVAEVDSV